MLIAVYEPQIVLGEAFKQGTWSGSPGERMVELCRATGVRLGLVTNGEQWMLVDAPVGAVTTFASWYGRLWSQEPITLQAFVSLLGIRRFFVDRSEQLPALLDNSLKYQDEVTDALGEQVRRAVEVLIQALDRAHVDSNRTLLEGVEPAELYEAGLTVMMRIVFLLSAEERGLLLLGDELYEANYAVSTLRMQLRAESEEILERRWDAWSRLLSLFRAVFGGIDHEALRLPALGGSLFDPDRFPFLEGRPRGSQWKVDMARPLPIDNRTVLLLLEAVQLFRGRTLSYMALDVEQIGYVYEGLLERTVVRAAEVTLDLDATKNAQNPWVTLPEVEDAAAQGPDALEKLLRERTESSASRVRNDLNRPVDDHAAEKLLTACHADRGLRDRVKPYFHFLRTDPWGYPLVYPKGTFMVASGSDRRETGTHYTPKSLTEAIVERTLEPVAYIGPAEGATRSDWRLKSAAELLELKVCDPAMGSGAFLVQVCRWLSERLVEAWAEAEQRGKSVTAEGDVADEIGGREPLRPDSEERMVTARRLIAERCLYGVDLNPLAVELAKLSIWLVTLAKGRPFGFLDHNLRCGDSLLGVTTFEQLHTLEVKPSASSQKKLFAADIDQAVTRAVSLRLDLRARPVNDIRDVAAMANLDVRARATLELPLLVGDALIAEVLSAGGSKIDTTSLSIDVGNSLSNEPSKLVRLRERAFKGLRADYPSTSAPRRPFHWPLEFPEVFIRENKGFDAMVGNPPFMHGSWISTRMGAKYAEFLRQIFPHVVGKVDFVVYFLNRAASLIGLSSTAGLILTSKAAQGDARKAGLDHLVSSGYSILFARPEFPWPGKANVMICLVCVIRGEYNGANYNSRLETKSADVVDLPAPRFLPEQDGMVYLGAKPDSLGFVIDLERFRENFNSDEFVSALRPYYSGSDLNTQARLVAPRYIIDFSQMSLAAAAKFPALLEIVEREVKPKRLTLKRESYRQRWWQFTEPQTEAFRKIRLSEYTLAVGRVSKYFTVRFVPSNAVYSDKVVLFVRASNWEFAVLSSEIHNQWALYYGTTHGQGTPNYKPTDCGRTFPFPRPDASQLERLSECGEELNRFREAMLFRRNIGPTELYNMFHDSDNKDEDIQFLRELHSNVDREVLQSYGWDDLSVHREFRETKQGIRLTYPSGTIAEILGRTNRLNRERFLENEGRGVPTAILSSEPNDSVTHPTEPDLFEDESSPGETSCRPHRFRSEV